MYIIGEEYLKTMPLQVSLSGCSSRESVLNLKLNRRVKTTSVNKLLFLDIEYILVILTIWSKQYSDSDHI